MKKVKITYSSNNSGGSWWLGDKDWKALEKAGWYVIWGEKMFCHSRFSFSEGEWKDICKTDKCPGHRKFDSFKKADKNRWLGAVAKEATKEFSGKTKNDAILSAINEFEKLTGQSLSDEGCNCCGAPHTFEVECGKDSDYISGESFLNIISDKSLAKLSKRELLEKLKQ